MIVRLRRGPGPHHNNRIVGAVLATTHEKCPNPKGVTGICYAFDRFGDRNGCAACSCPLLTDEIYNSNGDPLPGLTKNLEKEKR